MITGNQLTTDKRHAYLRVNGLVLRLPLGETCNKYIMTGCTGMLLSQLGSEAWIYCKQVS